MTQDSPETFSCSTCYPKPAAWCQGCDRRTGTSVDPHHFIDARLSIASSDILIISESPVLGRGHPLQQIHVPYADDAGKIIAKTVSNVRDSVPEYRDLKVDRTYLVMCSGPDPAKDTQDRCAAFLRSGLLRLNKAPIIVAMGLGPAKALGIRASKLGDIQHRLLEGVEVDGRTYRVIVTVSSKMLVAVPGIYDNFQNDIKRAFSLTQNTPVINTALESLMEGYFFPKTLDEVEWLCEGIIAYPPGVIAVDTETNTKFPHRKKLKMLAVSFAWDKQLAAAIPLFHKETPYDPEKALAFIKRVLECEKPKTFHNGKFDTKVFARYNLNVNNWVWDSMLAEHTLAEDKKGQYGLKQLTNIRYPEYAGYADKLHDLLNKEESESLLDNLHKEEAQLPKRKKKAGEEDGGFENIPLSQLLPYAAIDTDITRRLSLEQLERMREEEANIELRKRMVRREVRKPFPIPNLCQTPDPSREIVRTRAVPTAAVLSRMELGGVRIDRPAANSLQVELATVINDAEVALYKMAARDNVKLNSPRDVGDILFNAGFVHPDTGMRTIYQPFSYTKTNQPQVNEKSLRYFTVKYGCPFSAQKLIYAKAFKAKNTFLVNVEALSAEDGFVHSNFNQHGTATYRLSSSDINLQNIPKKLSGRNIKKIFIPDDDSYIFVNADAKGAEVRILTAYCRDAALIQSLLDGQDTHSFIAAKIVEVVRAAAGAAKLLKEMGLDNEYPLLYENFAGRDKWKSKDPKYGEMLDKFRTAVKRVVFGILYGAGASKIAETIGISKEQAQLIIDMLFRMFPSILRYMEQTRWELRTFGMVETYFGHRRRFTVQGAAKFLLSRAERQGVNFKIQSTSSDIVMDCLRRIEQPLRRDFGGRLLLTVHDSIAFQLPKKYLGQLNDFITQILETDTGKQFPWLPVAFKWDYEVGPSYGELMPLDQYLEKNPLIEVPNELMEAYTEEEIRTELSDTES